MSSKEWLDKYNQLVDLVNELYNCPYFKNLEIQCSDCILNGKCANIIAISDYIQY